VTPAADAGVCYWDDARLAGGNPASAAALPPQTLQTAGPAGLLDTAIAGLRRLPIIPKQIRQNTPEFAPFPDFQRQ
jgi:hypothetical protein